ncbi:MAG: DUF3348 family protein [Hydrogenophaga sp.]|uniref:DUF3348 family protein n=1 Tax=Pseudotabrizicola sp. TaxID=2939647 RepID=UPI0027185B4B|nr:DUF3348 family protein [Pseudotabrizicola sp.]MDO9148708.1 DUF3348 family protein [Hydrogenophaga sp.]MDO9637481.1 DUF3348 family protein [Pseudotabrizicola sp.]
MVLRSNFSSSSLVRLLGDGMPAPADAPRQDFAERLGQWLNVADAIALHAAHQSIQAMAPGRPVRARADRTDRTDRTDRASALNAEFQRVRATLAQAIQTPPETGTAPKRHRHALPASVLPVDAQATPAAPDISFAPFQQRYQEHQRRMDMSLEALRGHVRQTLASATPALAQLAALDAVLDPLLGGREHKMLATVPAFLERRFDQLRQQHPADPAAPAAAAGWLASFEPIFQATLLAELDVRLQPVLGMIEALSNSVNP